MNKTTYPWLASLIMLLVTTLTSCEKFALDDLGGNSHDANTNVIIHVSAAKKQESNNSRKMDSKITRVDEEADAKPLENYCSRLSIAIFDGAEKVKTLNLTADDDGYDDIELYLDKGEYRMVAIGHNGSGNCTITSPDKVKFYKNKLTDTFFYYGRLSVEDNEDTEENIILNRAVAQFKVHITDTPIPAEAHSIQFYYTGGSSTLDATTGYGCVNSRQTETFKLSENVRDYSVYTFPHEENNGLKMTISILDADAQTIKEYTKEHLPVKCNYITKSDISIKDNTITDPDQGEKNDSGFSFTINPDWEGEIEVGFD